MIRPKNESAPSRAWQPKGEYKTSSNYMRGTDEPLQHTMTNYMCARGRAGVRSGARPVRHAPGASKDSVGRCGFRIGDSADRARTRQRLGLGLGLELDSRSGAAGAGGRTAFGFPFAFRAGGSSGP